MGQPAGPKAVSSTTSLDLSSDVAAIRADAICLSTYIDPSIFTVISSPGPRVPIPIPIQEGRRYVWELRSCLPLSPGETPLPETHPGYTT